jgi:hypothetical protein
MPIEERDDGADFGGSGLCEAVVPAMVDSEDFGAEGQEGPDNKNTVSEGWDFGSCARPCEGKRDTADGWVSILLRCLCGKEVP